MINLLFTGNAGAYDGLAMSLLSITKHCKQELNVVVLTMDLHEIKETYCPISKEDIKLLENKIQLVNAKSKITLVDVTELFWQENGKSKNMENSYSPYAFIRLLADKVEGMPNKILYLDIDIMANGDIAELYDYDITNYEYGAARDYYGRIFLSPIKHNYINSGVMLLNMERIKQTKLFEKCRDVVNNKKMMFPDQSALNKCAQAKLYLPMKYNSQRRLHKTDVVRHFCKGIRWYPCWNYKSEKGKHCQPFSKYFKLFHTVNVKPWDIWGMHNILKCHEFDDVYEELLKLKKLRGENYGK